MKVMDVIKIIKALNKGFGSIINELYLSEEKCWFNAGYIMGRFVIEDLKGFGEKVVELSPSSIEILYKDSTNMAVENEDNIIKFKKDKYSVSVNAVNVKDELKFEITGPEIDLDDLVAEGFNFEELFGESIVLLIENCIIEKGKVIVISPMWIAMGDINYKGERLEIGKGLVVTAKDLKGSNVRVVVGNDKIALKWSDGLVGISKRITLQDGVVEKVLEKLKYDKSKLQKINDLEWLKDWDSGEGIIVWADPEGRIINCEISRNGLNVEGIKIAANILKYRIGNKFVKYLLESESGIVLENRILWLNKKNTSLYIGIVKA